MVGISLTLQEMANAAVGSLIVLALGSAVVGLSRQPARRAWLVLLTLLGGLAAPWLGRLPVVPRWSARLLPAPALHKPEAVRVASGTAPISFQGATNHRLDTRAIGTARLPQGPAPIERASEESAVVPAQPRFVRVPWHLVIAFAYATVSAGFVAWWLFGQVLLWRLIRASRPTRLAVRDHFFEVSGPAGERVTLLESERIGTPITSTWMRPVIVMPEALCEGDDSVALRYCLAHEWSHVERGDSWAWNLASFAGFVLFYQPLYWWLRRQLRLDQDFLADDRAAALGSTEDYAAFLVSLSRLGIGRTLPTALGVGGPRSNLSRRIVMLLKDRRPYERRPRTTWSLMTTACAVLLTLAVSGLRLGVSAPPEAAGSRPGQPDVKTHGYSGRVLEKGTHKPIAEATVTVSRYLWPDPATGQNRLLAETKHRTDNQGDFRYTITTEQMESPQLRIVVDVEHPDYPAGHGYPKSPRIMLKDEELGDRYAFEVEMELGKPVTGTIVTPDGKPAPGIMVECSSYFDPTAKPGFLVIASVSKMRTDHQGRFRFVAITPGVVTLTLCPERFAMSVHRYEEDRRGDLGRFVLSEGVSLTGKVVDAEDRPLGNVRVKAAGSPKPWPKDSFEALMPGTELFSRSTVTNAQGEFHLPPLAGGTYKVTPVQQDNDVLLGDVFQPLPAPFAPQEVAFKKNETPGPIVFRPLPSVTVEARVLDSEGKHRSELTPELIVSGLLPSDKKEDKPPDPLELLEPGMEFWCSAGKPEGSGKIVFHAPRGLSLPTLNVTSTTSEGYIFRSRIETGAPLSHGENLSLASVDPNTNDPTTDLGTLDRDVKSIEIIVYKAPVLLIKVVATDGSKPQDVQVTAEYARVKVAEPGSDPAEENAHRVLRFVEQKDARFRSSEIFPGEEVTVKAQAKGLVSKSTRLTLTEGTILAIEMVLEKE